MHRIDQSVENGLGGDALLGPIDVSEQRMDDVDDAEPDIDRCVEIASQRSFTISLVESGFTGGDGPIEYVERNSPQKVALVGKVSIQGRNADAGGPRDGVT